MTSSADWDEIQRLAADFQKVQLCSTAQRLSERNCVEIVTKLIELKLIDVIFTSDGKEYLTPQQLIREIKDEIYVHGGRINTVDLAKQLNVDLNQINSSSSEIVKGKEVQLVSGYLIAHYYFEKIAREINEKLQQQGQISIGELTLQYDLPADILQYSVVERNLGKLIHAQQDTFDARIFYTEEYITRTKAKIKGALMGLLKPTPLAVIINQCNLTDRLFMALFDHVDAPGTLTGRQIGATYVPMCYTKSQTDWVINFYKQNNYLEYDALTRFGISDPKTFVKRIFPNEDLLYLKTCAVGIQLREQIEMALEECISSRSYIDVLSLLPTVFSDADIEALLDTVLKNNSKSTVLFDNTVFSLQYLEQLKEACLPMIDKKSEEAVKSGKYQQFYLEKQLASKILDSMQHTHVDHKAERREERRRKAASGKGGGGTQGRETKTKAVKKHQKPSKLSAHDSNSDDNATVVKKRQGNLEIISLSDVENVISEIVEKEGFEDLLSPIVEYLHGDLNNIALNLAKESAAKLLQDKSQNRKQTHTFTQDKINILINDIKLYEKGLKLLPAEQHPHFVKYLLKSLGGEIVSEFCKYAASQCNLSVQDDVLTTEQRNKIINDCSEDYMKPLRSLNSAALEQDIDVFYKAVDMCLAECGMILKKVDKKKDRLLIQNHREKLIDELKNSEDPAIILHLAVLAIFTILTQNMLHASGRQVPHVVSFLLPQLKEDEQELLQLYHELVTKYLTSTDDEEKVQLYHLLRKEIPSIKKLVISIKK